MAAWTNMKSKHLSYPLHLSENVSYERSNDISSPGGEIFDAVRHGASKMQCPKTSFRRKRRKEIKRQEEKGKRKSEKVEGREGEKEGGCEEEEQCIRTNDRTFFCANE